MEKKLLQIMEGVFGTSLTDKQYEDINPSHITEWDSFTHLHLISSLEDEFEIEIDVDDIVAANEGFLKIVEIIRSKVVS